MFNIIRDDLYYVPIENLNLSVKTLNLLKRTGITSVGDCLDIYEFSNSGITAQIRFDIKDAIDSEVINSIIEYLHDYHLISKYKK